MYAAVWVLHVHGAIKTDHIQLSIHGRNVHGSMGSHFDFRHATSFPILPVELSQYMRVGPFPQGDMLAALRNYWSVWTILAGETSFPILPVEMSHYMRVGPFAQNVDQIEEWNQGRILVFRRLTYSGLSSTNDKRTFFFQDFCSWTIHSWKWSSGNG